MPAPEPSWEPTAEDLAGLPAAGRVFVEDLVGRFEFSAVEGRVVLEAGHCVAALAALRALDDDDVPMQRLEMAWSRLLAAHLAQLRVTP